MGLRQFKAINDFVIRRDGTIWVATPTGLHFWDGQQWQATEVTERLFSLVELENGDLWLGTTEGARCHHCQNPGIYEYEWGARPIGGVNNRFWVGAHTYGNRDVYQFQNKVWTAYPVPMQHSTINSLFPTANGDLWLGTSGEGVRHWDEAQKMWHKHTDENGLSHNFVRALAVAEDGTVWVGTMESGLNVWQNGRWSQITTHDGLAGNAIFDIAIAADQTVWVITNGGISYWQP